MARNLSSLTLLVGANIKGFQTQMRKMSRDMKRVGGQMKNMGKSMSMYVTAPIIALGAASVKTFANFEQEMAKVNAVSGATNAEFQKLTKNAKLLGESTRFTASQVAALQLNYSKLGFKPDEILKVTDATLNLALATGSDLAESATVAASTLRGFELSASEMQRVTDVMALSFSSSALDLEKFKTAMATVAPVAKNAGMSLEQTTAMLGVLVNRGVDASTAGTSLRNIFLTLAKDGITLEQAFSRINNASNKNKESLALFGKRGATVATILAENTEEAGNLAVKFDNAAGSAASMAGIMDNTLQGSFLKVQSALEGLAIEFGKTLKPVVEDGIKVVQELIGKFRSLTPQGKKMAVMFSLIAAAIGPLMMVLGLFVMSAGAIGSAFTAAFGPVGLAVAAIVALAAAFIYVYDNFEAFKERLSDWDWLSNAAIDAFIVLIKASSFFMNEVAKLFGYDFVAPMVEKLEGLKTEPKNITTEFKSFGDSVKNVFSDVMGYLNLFEGNLKSATKTRTIKIQTKIETSSMIAKKTGDDTSMADGGDRSIKLIPPSFDEYAEKTIKNWDDATDSINQSFSASFAQMATTIGEGLGDMISGIDPQFGSRILEVIGGFLKSLGAALITYGTTMLAFTILSSNPWTAGAAIAVGIAAVAAAKIISNMNKKGLEGAKMKDGGIVPGGFPNDTYPALLTSGEMVVPSPIPLSGGMGAGGNMNFTGTSRISGKDLLLVFDKAKADRNRTTGY